MSRQIPLSFVTYREDNPAKGRWDQLWLERMLAGDEGRPPCGYEFVETPWRPSDGRGRVVVFSAGCYAEHGEERAALERLIGELYEIEWAVLFATSDECQTFPWRKYINPWPAHVKLWVQLPRSENRYPTDTRFFAEGSPASAKQFAVRAQPDWRKDIDVFFSGQMGHDRRTLMWEALGPMREDTRLNVVAHATGGFTQGMGFDEYAAHMCEARFVPCPSGICSQSSFRAFEALEAQAIPIVDELRPGQGQRGSDRFWHMLGLGFLPDINDWAMLPHHIADYIRNEPVDHVGVFVQSQWQQYKRRILSQIHEDVYVLDQKSFEIDADDQITVIIPTSPVPSNPSLDIILETIASVRERLPRAEILITCDGVREEQQHLAADYWEFVRRLCAWTNSQDNITPFAAQDHLHQAGLAKMVLPEVRTPYLLYVEHDCPLVGEIPFGDLLWTMRSDELAVMRLYHEAAIHPEHEHLMLGHVGPVFPGPDSQRVEYIQTIQWSQRPHLAETRFYRNMIASYFADDARTMIEDVMHGIVQAAPVDEHGTTYPEGIRAVETWRLWRLAVYAPEGDIKRSTHLDARAGEPKFAMLMSYPGERPVGAPPEGWN